MIKESTPKSCTILLPKCKERQFTETEVILFFSDSGDLSGKAVQYAQSHTGYFQRQFSCLK